MANTFKRPKSLANVHTHYCPGCTHGIIHRLIAQAIDELGCEGQTVGIAPVGCAVFAYNYFNFDMIEAAHGRAPAVATGVKRTNPNLTVFTYQGDGDMAAIGTAETIHAAARGEKIVVIAVNNSIYGMTGGQMAPTSLIGQKTTTSPYGREISAQGPPIGMCELLATLEAPSLIARCAVNDFKNINQTRKLIKNAFERGGFCFIEVLSTCPTNWKMSPAQALEWQKENQFPTFPLGVYKDKEVEND